MRRKILSVLAFVFFTTGLFVAYFEINQGFLMNFQVAIFGLKQYEKFVLITLYGLAAIFSMTLAFGNKPKGAKSIYLVATLMLSLVFGLGLYNEIMFGMFFLGGGNLDVVHTIFILVGLYLSIHLFYCVTHLEKHA